MTTMMVKPKAAMDAGFEDYKNGDIDDEVDNVLACFLCNAKIDSFDNFEAYPCHHHYHINCINEYQRLCVVTMDGIVACKQCGVEVTNLSGFHPISPKIEQTHDAKLPVIQK
jgi:hypothetical protein